MDEKDIDTVHGGLCVQQNKEYCHSQDFNPCFSWSNPKEVYTLKNVYHTPGVKPQASL